MTNLLKEDQKNGVLEYWSNVLDCSIAFLDHQMVCPFSEFSFFLESLHEFQQTVFEFERKLIDSFKILYRNLFSLSAGIET
jgi:hypothetical protein